jgi:23S rRNA pseudouridine1911/1915/1917 synthase
MNYFNNTNQDCIVRLVNRLDRDTSGLVIIAKSQYAHQGMAKKLDNNQIEKTYIAVVEGRLEGKDTIDMPIDRPAPESMKREVMEGGQRAVTHYEALASSDKMSVLSIKLETGKTHQIRVHMKTIGHPIVGDSLYGNVSEYIDRQALHAHRLRFSILRDNIDVEVLAELPADMKKLVEIVERSKLLD